MGGSLPSPAEEDLERWRPPVPEGDPRHPSSGEDVAAVWTGLVWGRLGRVDLALRWWELVDDPALAPWVAAEQGRVLRELGLHARARQLEEEGLTHARDATDIVMLRLSLAADLVGLGELDRARSALAAVSPMVPELPDGPRAARQRLRQRWIAVELALAAGERPSTDGLPATGDGDVVHPPEADHGTDFHRAKGLLVAAVAREDRELMATAARLAPPMLSWAVELARLDVGDERAADRAVAAWQAVKVPADLAVAAAATPSALRLDALR